MAGSSVRNQTQSFLIRRFAEAGIEPRTKLGQNFLVDLNLQRLLLNTARLEPSDVVLEVGTGTGSLTARMADQAALVISVEVDPDLHQMAAEALDGLNNVILLRADALKNKNRMNPELLDLLSRKLAERPGRRLKLVANLPYQVATPVLTNLLAEEPVPQTMTVTIQKELADRIVARPGTRDYGALSIWVQSQCRARIVRGIPPAAFWPRPKVRSAIVQVTLDERLRARIPNRAFFHRFVRSLFFHRRKFLRSELISALKGQLGKPEVDAVLDQLQIAGTVRAEELDVKTMLALAELCRQRVMAAGGEESGRNRRSNADAVH